MLRPPGDGFGRTDAVFGGTPRGVLAHLARASLGRHSVVTPSDGIHSVGWMTTETVDDDDRGTGRRPELWEHPPRRPSRGGRGTTTGTTTTTTKTGRFVEEVGVGRGDDSSAATTRRPWRETEEDEDEEEEDDDDVAYELDPAWAARFAATEKMRAARAKERARRNAGDRGGGGRGRGRGGNAAAMGRAPRAEEAAMRVEALVRRSRVRDDGDDGGGDDDDARAAADGVGPSALAWVRKVELYGEVGAVEVGRLEAEINAAFDAWMDAGDAAYFPTVI